MAKPSASAHRHIREWSKFFAGGRAVAETTVDKFLSRHKRRRYLKQSLDHLVARGFIKRRGGKFTPTESGLRFFRKKKGVRIKPPRWDGKWRLITFDVPGGYNIARDRLRALLKEFDFYPLQKSVWISPSYVSDEFWKDMFKYDLDQYCKIMLVDIIEGDRELKKYFKRIAG